MPDVDFQRIEDAAIAWVETATALTAIWANQSKPRPSRPYAVLQWIAGPDGTGGFDEIVHRQALTELDVLISSVAEDDRVSITVNQRLFFRDPTAVDTVLTVRDAILADMALVTNEGFVAASLGVDSIRLTPSSPGELWSVRVFPPDTEAPPESIVTIPTFDTEVRRYQRGDRELLLQVAVNSTVAVGANSARAKVYAASSALHSPETIAQLKAEGLASRSRSTIRDLSRTIDDERIESRAAFDVIMATFAQIPDVVGAPDDTIDNVAFSITGFTPTGATTVP